MNTPAIEEIAENIWVVEGKCVNFYSFAYPTRSVIVRMKDGGLWVWSPIALNDNLKKEVDALGAPKFLVSPNKIHHLFLKEWQLAYPDAVLCGPASTIAKRADLSFGLTLDNVAPDDWTQEIDQAWFNGSRFMDEVVFFHRASHTAILADLSENFSKTFLQKHWKFWQRPIARLWGIVEGKGYAPLEWRHSFTDKKGTHAARDKVLAWNATRVIMAHGTWQRDKGRAFLAKSFSWM